MAVTEGKKVTKNQPICESAGWLFTPLSFHPWAGLGPLGSGLVNRLVKQVLGDTQGWARQHLSADIWQRLSATLMSHVGEQLLVSQTVTSRACLPLSEGQGPRTTGATTNGTVNNLPVADVDMLGWHKATPMEEEGVPVGPIRIQCTRPLV